MLRSLLLRLSTRRALGEELERWPLTRGLVRRFVPGPDAAAALDLIARVNADGLLAAVTYLGENVTTPAEAARAADVYIGLLDEVQRRGLQALPSLKLTHLGLDLSEAVCLENLRRVLRRAEAVGTLVWIDMESSAYTQRTLDLYARVRAEHRNAACVIQAYLRRSAADVERLVELGAAVRLCKGAYREPAAVAFPTKREVDENYARLLARLLSADALARGVYPAFATHDPRLIGRLRERARARSVIPDQFEIQMLYGIRPDLHRSLLGEGLRLRLLIPFGEDWYGYFVRRLAERPANLLLLLPRGARRRDGEDAS